MDEQEIPTDGGEAEEISPEEGVAEAEAEQETAEEVEPSYDFLEVDDTIRSKYVPVKVDGEEVPVSFDDLISSYSRESVSTKRFQEAAQTRQEAENAIRLQQAMQADPGMTIQYLARQADVSVEEFLGMTPKQQQEAVESAGDEDEYVDPLERQLREQNALIQEMRSQMDQRAADERLHSAVGKLKSDFGINDDQAKQVIGRAVQLNVGLEALPWLYRAMRDEANEQATAQRTAETEAEKQRRQAAAQKAQEAVGTGTGAIGTTSEVTGNFTSIRESAMAALEGLGIQ